MNARIPLLCLALISPVAASEVILDYKATIDTTIGNPFGMEIPHLTEVIGHFVYETEGDPDIQASSARGEYRRPGAFVAKFLGTKISGSAQPTLKVENIRFTGGSIDTFRFIDGNDDSNPMFIDNDANDSIEVNLSLTDGTGLALESDTLPASFQMQMATPSSHYSISFSLKNAQGTMLLQFEWLRQRTEQFRITELTLAEAGPMIDFQSIPGMTYSIEFITDLAAWSLVAANHPDDGYSTEFLDEGMYARIGALPSQGFYRITENR